LILQKIYISGETFADKKYPPKCSSNKYWQSKFKSNGYFSEGFIAKFNSDGDREWGTYYGGLDDDYITDSQIDSNGLLYVLGISSSSNNISTINTNTLVILMQIVS
jgi:hypothetical protein